MMNRDEYVQKLKTQIDAWNAEVELRRLQGASADAWMEVDKK
jgi:hypothetical protein